MTDSQPPSDSPAAGPSLPGYLHDAVAVGQALLDVLQQQAAVALEVVLPQQLQHRLPVPQVVRRLELVLALRGHHDLRVARQRLRLKPLRTTNRTMKECGCFSVIPCNTEYYRDIPSVSLDSGSQRQINISVDILNKSILGSNTNRIA